MTQTWTTVPASAVKPGDRVRAAGDELTVTRIQSSFLGRSNLLALIEDSPQRWYKRPVPADAEVEVEVVG